MPMPASFVAAPAKPAGGRHAVNPSHWWQALHDRELESLIERAATASPTVEIALSRVQEARAQEAVVVGAALPALEATEGGALGTGGDLARGRAAPALVSAENGAGFTQVTNLVGFDAAWELDFFGKLRRAIESAHYDVQAAIAARNIVLVSLIADVTRAYLEMRALQMQLAVLRKSIGGEALPRFRQRALQPRYHQ
jgi:multidrug efflux system outer membrane protein